MMSQIRLQKVAKQEICARRGKEETGAQGQNSSFTVVYNVVHYQLSL